MLNKNEVIELFKAATNAQPIIVTPLSVNAELGAYCSTGVLGYHLTDLAAISTQAVTVSPLIEVQCTGETGPAPAPGSIAFGGSEFEQLKVKEWSVSDKKLFGYVLSGDWTDVSNVTTDAGFAASVESVHALIESFEPGVEVIDEGDTGVRALIYSLEATDFLHRFDAVFTSVKGDLNEVETGMAIDGVDLFMVSDVQASELVEDQQLRKVFVGQMNVSFNGDMTKTNRLTFYSHSGDHRRFDKCVVAQSLNRGGFYSSETVVVSGFDYQPVGDNGKEVIGAVQLNGYIIRF